MSSDEREGTNASAAASSARPKRPLSAFNLFYRFKRQRILDALTDAPAGTLDKDAITRLVDAAPGLEGEAVDGLPANKEELEGLRRENIRRDLAGNATARDNRARDRKSQGAMNGTISFVELGKLMNASWKSCDDHARSVFDELSQEGRAKYFEQVEEYNRTHKEEIEEEKRRKEKKNKEARKKNKKRKGEKKEKSSEAKKMKKRQKKPGKDSESSTEEADDVSDAAKTMLHLTRGSTPSRSTESVGSPALSCMKAGPNEAWSPAAAVRPSYDQDMNLSSHSQSSLQGATASPGSRRAPKKSLMQRVHRLEGQLAEERLRSRIRELESEIALRRAREEALRSAIASIGVAGRAAGGALGMDGMGMNMNRSPSAILNMSGSPSAMSSGLPSFPAAPSTRTLPSLPSLVPADVVQRRPPTLVRDQMFSRFLEPRPALMPRALYPTASAGFAPGHHLSTESSDPRSGTPESPIACIDKRRGRY